MFIKLRIWLLEVNHDQLLIVEIEIVYDTSENLANISLCVSTSNLLKLHAKITRSIKSLTRLYFTVCLQLNTFWS